MPCIVQGGHWCHITVLSGHAPTEDKSDDTEGQFYEGLRCVLNHYPKYHMKILLKISVQRWGREDIFKVSLQNESLYQTSNGTGLE